jgi:hypothetical protein
VDATSLRVIYNVLQGIVPLSDLQNLSNTEIILVKNTAVYLLCEHIKNVLQEMIDSTEKEINIVEEKNQVRDRVIVRVRVRGRVRYMVGVNKHYLTSNL